MTQKDIMDALQKSLTQGSGSLDDLSNLLTRVQADIEQAKKDEADNKRKAEDALDPPVCYAGCSLCLLRR